MVEHCSADKLMQQSRLSQQHTPSLAQCLHQLVPRHGCLGDRLPRFKKKTKKNTPKYGRFILKLGSLTTLRAAKRRRQPVLLRAMRRSCPWCWVGGWGEVGWGSGYRENERLLPGSEALRVRLGGKRTALVGVELKPAVKMCFACGGARPNS